MKKEANTQERVLPFYRRAFPRLYFAVLAVMAIMILLNVVLKDTNRADRFGLESFVPMNEGWFTASGEPFEIARIDELRMDGANGLSIYYVVPDGFAEKSMVFRSKNCVVSVRVDGREIYATDVANAPFYNHSPGTRWNIVSVGDLPAGTLVELWVGQAYQDGRAKVDNFYYGDRAAISLFLIREKLWGLVVSLLIFFVALVFLAAWVVLNWHRSPKNHSLLWLAVFGMVAACWCLLETNVMQFFFGDLRLIQVMNNMMLVIGGMPLYLYLDSVYQVFRKRTVRLLCALDLAYILFATFSQLVGLWDFHQTLNGAVVTYGIVITILIICLARQGRQSQSFTSKSEHLFFFMQQAGILLLGLGLLGDLVRYLFSDVLDRAFLIRLGLLGFIVCFGAGNVYQMIVLVKKGMEAEFISQLAYSDGLTKISNRTAYLERLQHLQKDYASESLALVMFDINNLKWVNDTLGHKSGDELIVRCAHVLREVFGPPWHVYRIGGDEFVALIHSKDVKTAYKHAADRFTQTLRALNENGECEYPLIIAHGVAFASSITQETVEAAEKEADRRMYENKYELKFAEKHSDQ